MSLLYIMFGAIIGIFLMGAYFEAEYIEPLDKPEIHSMSIEIGVGYEGVETDEH